MLISVNGVSFNSWAAAVREYGAEYGMSASAAQRWLVNKGLKVEVDGASVEVVSTSKKKPAYIYAVELVKAEYLKGQKASIVDLESRFTKAEAEADVFKKFKMEVPTTLQVEIDGLKTKLADIGRVSDRNLLAFFKELIKLNKEAEEAEEAEETKEETKEA